MCLTSKMQFMIIHFKNLFWYCVWSRHEVQCKMHRYRVLLVFTNWYFWWTWLQAGFLMLLCNEVRLFNFPWENLIERNYAIVSLCSPCCVFQDQVVSCHLTDVQSRVPFAAFNVVFYSHRVCVYWLTCLWRWSSHEFLSKMGTVWSDTLSDPSESNLSGHRCAHDTGQLWLTKSTFAKTAQKMHIISPLKLCVNSTFKLQFVLITIKCRIYGNKTMKHVIACVWFARAMMCG